MAASTSDRSLNWQANAISFAAQSDIRPSIAVLTFITGYKPLGRSRPKIVETPILSTVDRPIDRHQTLEAIEIVLIEIVRRRIEFQNIHLIPSRSRGIVVH